MSKLLPHTWAVPDRFRTRLGAQAGRQRAMVHEGHLLLVLHVLPNPHDPLNRTAAFFWRAPDGSWKATGATSARSGVPALKSHVEAFTKVVAELEDRLEKAARAADYFAVVQESGPVLRTARNLHKALQEAREGVPNDQDLISLRDLAGDVERGADLVHSDAKAGLEFTIARRAEDQADLAQHIATSGHRLNLLAALFFPVTAIATVMGMNLRHGLEDTWKPYLFWVVLTGTFIVGFIVRGSLGRRPSSSS